MSRIEEGGEIELEKAVAGNGEVEEQERAAHSSARENTWKKKGRFRYERKRRVDEGRTDTQAFIGGLGDLLVVLGVPVPARVDRQDPSDAKVLIHDLECTEVPRRGRNTDGGNPPHASLSFASLWPARTPPRRTGNRNTPV